MGMYRTIPTDVEAVQFKGMKNDEPVFAEMGAAMPSWMWRSITRGNMIFDSVGIKVNGAVLKEGEWIVFDGLFVTSMSEEKFNGTFVPARKPLSEMASAPKSLRDRRVASDHTPAAAEAVQAQTAPSETPKTEVSVSSPPMVSEANTLGVPKADAMEDADAMIDKLMGA